MDELAGLLGQRAAAAAIAVTYYHKHACFNLLMVHSCSKHCARHLCSVGQIL